MKSSLRTTAKAQKTTARKSEARRAVSSKSKGRSALAGMGRSVKRYGKQTLRELLLSKTFNASVKVFIGFLMFGSAMYGAYAFIGNSIAHDIVISQSEILARVGKHIQLPEGEPEALVRVQDPESLKKQNNLYENVKEGDYIIIYPTLAVVYDLRNDHIIALRSTQR